MNMEFVTIGYPNNPPDRWRLGCVPYEYEIGKYQVSNADWAEFVESTGDMSFVHKDMKTGILGGWNKPEWAKKPVTYIRYEDACRFCNWMMTGDTERGAYDMRKVPPKRLVGAVYFLPNEDEWYKAAYWRQDEKRYVKYPTGDTIPELDEANFERGDDFSVGAPYYFADVDAFADHATREGVVQLGGNAWELLENVTRNRSGKLENHYRGGSFGYTETGLSKGNCDTAPYNGRCYVFGFRVARIKNGWRRIRKPLIYGIT